jgi:ribosome recycling factor
VYVISIHFYLVKSQKYTLSFSIFVIEYSKEREKSMETIIKNCEDKMKKAIDSIEYKFTKVRAGRANPAMLDGINVEYYGVETPIKQLANISIPEARQLSIKPFDKSVLNSIEKAIFEANIGLTPNNNGECIFLVIPPLTEDRRKELVRQVKELAEEGKIALRNIRQEANGDIKNLKLPEDEEKKSNERVQELINKYNKIIDEKLKDKEKELMTI